MTEQELIKRAIESARCRIYRVSATIGGSLAHQVRVENQIEIQQVTIEALEKQISQKPNNIHQYVDHKTGYCPSCNIRLAHFGDMNYCHKCGNKLDWRNEDAK